eukprot:scaffold295554_cov31-Tisochrysis_lutea.AAC.1
MISGISFKSVLVYSSTTVLPLLVQVSSSTSKALDLYSTGETPAADLALFSRPRRLALLVPGLSQLLALPPSAVCSGPPLLSCSQRME